MDLPTDSVAWARRVNARWLVQASLRTAASNYMDHLQGIDAGRLERSCAVARELVAAFGEKEDPKPWFYAALFSLATPPEATQFLSGHAFTCAALPWVATTLPNVLDPRTVGPDTWTKILRIREELKRRRGAGEGERGKG